MSEQRPDPDALLAAAMREGRGRLKIFLGAAPGVGKTWKMLAEAQRFRRAGIDVLAGVIETHGREETRAQADGLPVLPMRPVAYRGRMLEEFDLDAALAKRPSLLLIDELAHDNAPGSRHAKRWEDVLALVAAGLTVWTTLNVQHLESLNDDIARITGVRVSETVPDRVLDRADEIELIDLSPADLRARLQEGKIYRPDNAARALDGYFREGNLAALREIALRRTASHVDDAVRGWMRDHRVAGPWPVAERVLALVGPGAAGEAVIREARRIADALHAPLLALHVERPAKPAGERPPLALATLLGAEVEVRSGNDLVGVVLSFAAARNVTRIVIGRRVRIGLVQRLRRRNLALALLRRAGPYALVVVADSPAPHPKGVAKPAFRPDAVRWTALTWAGATALVAVVTLAGLWWNLLAEQETIGMVFLAVVVSAATLRGLALALYTAMIGFLAWDFFFIPPVHQITISDAHDAVALLVFLLVAGLTGWLGGKVRAEATAGQARIESLRRIGTFSRRLGVPATEPELLAEIVRQAAAIAERAVLLVVPDQPGDSEPEMRAAEPAGARLDQASLAAARWSARHQVETGRGTVTLPSAAWRFLPMRTRAVPADGKAGPAGDKSGTVQASMAVLGVQPPHDDAPALQALETLVDQAAIALERVRLTGVAARSAAMEDTQKLRTALLNSLGHDLRTPLTGIRGAAETLRESWEGLSPEVRIDLLSSIEEDTGRMTRFLANIMDLTRLESGQIVPRLAPVELGGVIEAAIARVPGAAYATVALPPEPQGRTAQADAILLEQVLVNVLDNAAHYAPRWSHIALRVTRLGGGAGGDEIRIDVADEGVGVPEADLPHLFDSFFRGTRGDRTRPGTGLGLAIARGLVEAMDGRISAISPRPDVPRDAAPGMMVSIHLKPAA
jgi:two-component system sensor histidine kinase KdpD